MIEKAPDAFRNITEVSTQLNIPTHVLRFWETRFRQIKPLKRSGGRRYYRPEDIQLLMQIRELLYSKGYTIKGAQQILDAGAAVEVASSEAVSTEAVSSEGGGNLSAADLSKAMGLLTEASTRLRVLEGG